MAFDYQAARRDGHSDTDIINYLMGKGVGFDLEGARSDGHSDQDIVRHLLSKDTAVPATPDQEKYGWFDRTIAGPVIRGFHQLQTTEAVMGGVFGWKDQEETAAAIADAQRGTVAAPTSEAAQAGLREIMETTRSTPGTAGAWAEAAIDVLTNLPAVWDITVSSMVSSIPGLVGFAGGTFGGGAIAGPPGALIGAMTGTGIGSFAVEYSQSLVATMSEEGVNTQSEEEVLSFLQNDVQMAKARENAIKRGISIALFDAVTAGVAGRLFKPTAKIIAGEKAAMAASNAGIAAADVARRAGLARGNMTVKQIERAASEAALRATGKALSRTARAGGAGVELAAQMTGGAAGEAAAQLVTEGEISGPGEVLLEAIAEGPVGGIQALVASQRPRVAPDPLDPSVLPEAPTPIAREAYDAPLDGDPIAFVERQAANFIFDMPTSIVNGTPSTERGDYNVVRFSGKDVEGETFSGWRAETKAGVPITPVIDNEAKAEGALEAFLDLLPDVIATQEQEEINLRAADALGPDRRADENPELFAAAQEIDKGTLLNLGDQTPATQRRVTAWRETSRKSKNQEVRDTVPIVPEGKVAVEEMSLAGVRNSSIAKALENADDVAIGKTEDLATAESLKALTTKRNINTEDDAFWNAVRRVTGFRGTGDTATEKFKNMAPHQRQAFKEMLENLKSSLPGKERQSLPVTKRRPFTGAQYNTVIAATRRQRARDRYWKVETKDGEKVPRSRNFDTRHQATVFKAAMKDKGKGTRIKAYKNTIPLREGEIQKSDITALLGKKEKNTDAILDAAVERGDLIKSRGTRNRWRLAEYEIREIQPLAPGLQKRLAARLRGSGIPTDKISVTLAESLEDIGPDVEAVYVDHVIKIAMNKLPENATEEEAKKILGGIVDHEVIHALFELGLFSDDEKASLYRFTAGTVIPKESGWYNPEHPKQTYFSRADRVYRGHSQYQQKDEDGNTVPNVDKIAEEGVAEAFKDFAANVLTPAGRPRSLLNRIITFFRGLTTVSPADARYFVHKLTPIKEGLVEPLRRKRKVVAGQADVDIPVEERGPRYSLDRDTPLTPAAPKTASEILDFIRANPEGFVLDIEGRPTPPTGYVVAPVKAAETKVKVKELNEAIVDSFIKDLIQLRAISQQPVYMGGWLNPKDNMYYLDGVQIYDNLEEALYLADVADQTAIWDLGKLNEVWTKEGISSLQEAGAYSDRRHNELRRSQGEIARRFTPGRDTSEARPGFPVPTGREATGLDRETYDRRRANQKTGRESDLRYTPVETGELTGDGRGHTEFFSFVTRGAEGRPTTKQKYEPVITLSDELGFDAEYQSHLGNFDAHIATSIPGFREVQAAVGEALVKSYDADTDVLDIGASEGALIKTISSRSDGNIRTVGVDPNVAMAETFSAGPSVEGAQYEVAAFGAADQENEIAWREGDGTVIRYYQPDRKFDVVHEAMVFQFISNDREPQIRRMKEMAKDDGLVIIEEKIFDNDGEARKQWNKNEYKKDKFKRQYFTKRDVNKKREEILVGMHDKMISAAETENILTNNFGAVAQFWDSGNFKGYAASDNPATLDKFLSNLQSLESDFSTTKTPRYLARAGGPRYSLAEDRMLDRLERRAADRSNEAERAARNAALEKRGIFTGFSGVDDNAFKPIKMFNGGVTNVPIDGKLYPVVMTVGHDQWSAAKNKYVGWGMRHAAHHLDDIVQNTGYNSVDDFIGGLLNMYHANRVLGPKALKEANFEVFQEDSWIDDIRGPKIVVRWWYDRWPVPGTLVLQKIDFSAEERRNPKLKGNSFASVVTAYALPSIRGKLEPRKSQIINPAASLTAKKAAYTAKPRESINKKLAENYSLSDPDGLPSEYKSLWNKWFGSGKQEKRSFGQYIFGPRSPGSDIKKYGKPSLFRWHTADRWEGVLATEMALRKEMPDLYNDIYADSSAGAMFAMLGRAAGLMQQLLVAGPVIFTRGFFHAINENIVNSAPANIRVLLRNELDQLKDRAGYRREDGSSHEVKGLMQIFYPMYAISKKGGVTCVFYLCRSEESPEIQGRGT